MDEILSGWKKGKFYTYYEFKRLSRNSYQDGSKLLADKNMNDIKRLITLLKKVVNYLINDGIEEAFYSCIKKSLTILKIEKNYDFIM